MTAPVPSIESLQKDIELGNSFRMEGIKQMLTLATGLLAFTVAFRPSLKPVHSEWLVWVSWGGLGASIVLGIAVMFCWERFYLSYREDWGGKVTEGKVARKRLTRFRRTFLLLQFLTFGAGVVGVVVFAALNLSNVVAAKS